MPMMLVVASSHFTYSVLEVEIHLSKKGAENQVVEFENFIPNMELEKHSAVESYLRKVLHFGDSFTQPDPVLLPCNN